MKAARSWLVAAGGEDLLELVDGQHDPLVADQAAAGVVEGPQRVLAGAQQDPLPVAAARQGPARQRRQQAGAQHRGLAAPGCADEREQRRADQSRHQLGDQPLAAEEVLGVVGLEGGEALERAHDRRLRPGEPCRPVARCLQLDHAIGELRLHRSQPLPALGRLVGDGADAAPRFAARPAARLPVHTAGDAAALREQDVDGRVVGQPGDVAAGDRLDAVRPERIERQRQLGVQPRERARVGAGGEHEHRPAGQVAERRQRGGSDVVDDQQGGAGRLADASERFLEPLGSAGVQHGRAAPVDLDSDLLRQARLADPVRPAHRGKHAVAALARAPSNRAARRGPPRGRRAAAWSRCRAPPAAQRPPPARRATGPGAGSPRAGSADPARARCRPARRARCACRGTPRAPPPGGRSGTARASAGRRAARAWGGGRRGAAARRPRRRGVRRRGWPRRVPRARPAAVPPSGRSPAGRTARRRRPRAAARATARAHRARSSRPARAARPQAPCGRRRRGSRSGRRRARSGRTRRR